MNSKEIIDKLSSLKEEVYNYITNTEHWIFYWITNEEIQDFIKEYPEDFEDRIRLSIDSLSTSPVFTIHFDDHPNDVQSIQRGAVLVTFRDAVKAKWLTWNNKIKEVQIAQKEEELSYYKKMVTETEKEIAELKNEKI